MDQAVFNLLLIADLALVVFPSMHSIVTTSLVFTETEYHFDEILITGSISQFDYIWCS